MRTIRRRWILKEISKEECATVTKKVHIVNSSYIHIIIYNYYFENIILIVDMIHKLRCPIRKANAKQEMKPSNRLL